MKKLTVAEIKRNTANLADERPMFSNVQIKNVVLKDGLYWLYFVGRGLRPLAVTASTLRTLEEAYGENCVAWKGKPMKWVDFAPQVFIAEPSPAPEAAEQRQRVKNRKPQLSKLIH